MDSNPSICMEPYELGCSEAYNFWLKYPAELDEDGRLVNIEDFKNSLIGNILKPITLEEFDAKIPQQVIGRIRIYGLILKSTDMPIAFHYRMKKIKEMQSGCSPGETSVEEYIIQKQENKIQLVATRSFSKAEENILYSCLARLFKGSTPFDDISEGEGIKNTLNDFFPNLFPFGRKTISKIRFLK